MDCEQPVPVQEGARLIEEAHENLKNATMSLGGPETVEVTSKLVGCSWSRIDQATRWDLRSRDIPRSFGNSSLVMPISTL